MTGTQHRDTGEADREGRVRIPADVEREDHLLAGLSARQLAILAVPAALVWAAYLATRHLVALPVFAALAAPIAIGVATLALGTRDGRPLDRLLLAALGQARHPRRLVPAPGGVLAAPSWAGRDVAPAPAPLVLPARHLGPDGVIDLGADGAVIICQAGAVNFALRTPGERQALVAGFARYLNSLTAPVQVLLRSQPVDLSAAIAALVEAAGGLPHPGLEATACAHAEFLAGLAVQRDLLTRQVLLVLSDPVGGQEARTRLARRAAEAATALGACGVALVVLEAPAAASVLAGAADPWAPARPAGLGGTDDVVVGASAGSLA